MNRTEVTENRVGAAYQAAHEAALRVGLLLVGFSHGGWAMVVCAENPLYARVGMSQPLVNATGGSDE